MNGTPYDKLMAAVKPLLHLWQSVRVSGMAVKVNKQWLNIGIRVDLQENPPGRRDIQSLDQHFFYYVMDYPIDSLPDVTGQLTRQDSFSLQDDQDGHGTFAQVLLRPSPANPSVPASPITWYGPQRRESKFPHHAGEAQRSAFVIGAFGERLDSVLDYDFRQELDTRLRQAEPAYDGVRGLAQGLFPGAGFESWQSTLAEIVADLPFEIEFIDDVKLVVRASPRISDGAFTARCFYEPGTEAKPPRIVFRQADATTTEAGALQWEHLLSWPTNSKSVKVIQFYHQVEIQSAQRNRAALRRAHLAETLKLQHERSTQGVLQPEAPKQSAGPAPLTRMPIFKTALEAYRAFEIVGEGGAGTVYRVQTESREPFAVKCLDPQKATTAKRKRFKTELRFCTKNEHKNIITVVDHGTISTSGKDYPFYVMPYYSQTLRDLMKNGIPNERVLPLFSQILDGVEAAHLKKLWHRDLKPENVLCEADGESLVVADFGIAHFGEEELYTLIETGARDRLANFLYAAPEQRVRGREVDHRADIYALGLMLNEMFTGHVLQGEGYTRISDIAPPFAYLDQIVEGMVQQSPEKRPNSIDEIKQFLIAKRNEFISRQKLDQLRQAVVTSTTVTDQFAENPIKVIDADIRGDVLVVVLNASPPTDWLRVFVQLRSITYIHGTEPSNWTFQGNEAIVAAPPDYIERNAQTILNNFKGYVQSANDLYVQHLEEATRQREENERRALREKIAEEERRQRIRNKLKV